MKQQKWLVEERTVRGRREDKIKKEEKRMKEGEERKEKVGEEGACAPKEAKETNVMH